MGAVGEWVGRLHRLGLPLVEQAPFELSYGNHPHGALLSHMLRRAKATAPPEAEGVRKRAVCALAEVQGILQPRLPGLPHGVVHGDMHFWNVLYAGERPVAIIDLDFLQSGPLLYDIAYASIWLTAWERDRAGEWQGVLDRYLAAYEQGRQRELTPTERECLPWARVLHDLFFFLSGVYHSWDRLPHCIADLESAEEMVRSLTS